MQTASAVFFMRNIKKCIDNMNAKCYNTNNT